MLTTITRLGSATAAAALVLAGCTAKDRHNPDSTAAARTESVTTGAAAKTDTAAHRMESAASTAKHGAWTDATILGFMRAANVGEVEEGQLAERKATNPAVKAFARQMVADHQAALAEAKTLASKTKHTPDTTADNVRDVMKGSRDELKELTDKKAGKEWDEEYMEKQIDDHKKVLEELQDAAKNTTDPELRAAITKVSGKVQEHLTKAEAIKEQLKS
jgi:putative membrane protein